MVSGAAAEHTIVLREHITELGDPASQAGSLFNQIHLQPSVGQIQRGAHTTNTAAYHQSRGGFTSDYPGFYHLQ